MDPKLNPVVSQLAQASLFCKVLYVAVLCGFCLSFSGTIFDVFSITPRLLLPPSFRIWTIVTYFLVETNFLVLVLDIVAIHLSGTVLEPLWGHVELLRYLGLVTATVALVITAILLVIYFIISDPELLFGVSIHGLAAFDAAILVAVKQILPDSVLWHTPLGRLKNSHLPCLVLSVCLLLCVFGALKWMMPSTFALGAVVGWTYLRFYQPHPNGIKGDMAEHFSFAGFFPSAVRGPIEGVSAVVYRMLVRLKICKPAIRRFVDVGQLHDVTVMMPTLDGQDAERRRQKALRDLSERLTAAKEAPAAWPSLDDETPSSPPASPAEPQTEDKKEKQEQSEQKEQTEAS